MPNKPLQPPPAKKARAPERPRCYLPENPRQERPAPATIGGQSPPPGRTTRCPPIRPNQYPKSGASRAKTSSTTSVARPILDARRARQSTLLTWSARITPVTPQPLGTDTSKG